METMERIQVIDISPFVENRMCAAASKDDVIGKVVTSLSELGFMYIVGHGIQDDVLQTTVNIAHDFFRRPIEEKMKVLSRDRAKRGYAPFETENFASLIGEKKPNDICEKIRFGPSLPANSDEDPYYSSKLARSHFTCNEWGDQAAPFKCTVLEYYAAMER
ncbi:DIN11 [Symbiodinium microadriaticum]|nr:DIN11 [Symbiodinium microadriaticum]